MLITMRTILACFLFVFLLNGLLCTQAQNPLSNQKFNGIIDIESETIDDYMTFSGSKLTPIIRVTISYLQIDPNDVSSLDQVKTKYEELWYRAGDPLACTVYNPLGLREGSITQITLHSKTKPKVKNMPEPMSPEEIKAEANALVRIYFDTTLIHALPTAIVVPNEIYSQFTDALANESFFDRNNVVANRNLDLSLVLPLVTDDGFVNSFLCYGTQNQ